MFSKCDVVLLYILCQRLCATEIKTRLHKRPRENGGNEMLLLCYFVRIRCNRVQYQRRQLFGSGSQKLQLMMKLANSNGCDDCRLDHVCRGSGSHALTHSTACNT